MQQSLILPVRLTLQLCLNLPKHLNIRTVFTQQSNYEQCKQIPRLIKSYLPVIIESFYSQQFVKLFLVIKINSLTKKQCKINSKFVNQLIQLYNHNNCLKIGISCSQAEIMSQIISRIQGNVYLNRCQFQNIIQGNALLAASCVFLIQNTHDFLKKQQYAFSLSFTSLGGRQIAFLPIVHQQKYHAGQIYFAKRVRQLFKISKKMTKQQIKVQDPYSMRCSPQVYGVSYDCLQQLKKNVQSILNKAHHKQIFINEKSLPNLLLQSETFSLKMDFLICSVQQIGATIFLRSQRILNQYLGKNKLRQHLEYTPLYAMLKSSTTMTSKNKILSQMTNFDTVNFDSYQKDIFFNSASYYGKISQLFNNLYYLLTLEILSSIQAFRDIYNGSLKEIHYQNQEMVKVFHFLAQRVSVWDKNQSFNVVKGKWQFN